MILSFFIVVSSQADTLWLVIFKSGKTLDIAVEAVKQFSKAPVPIYDARIVEPYYALSDSIKGLKSGFHIAVCGPYRDRETARSVRDAVNLFFPGTYIRKVTSDKKCPGLTVDARCLADARPRKLPPPPTWADSLASEALSKNQEWPKWEARFGKKVVGDTKCERLQIRLRTKEHLLSLVELEGECWCDDDNCDMKSYTLEKFLQIGKYSIPLVYELVETTDMDYSSFTLHIPGRDSVIALQIYGLRRDKARTIKVIGDIWNKLTIMSAIPAEAENTNQIDTNVYHWDNAKGEYIYQSPKISNNFKNRTR